MAFPPTDWLDWTPAEYDVGAPATSLSFERWFRNVVAAAQGAVGAPRISIGALQRISAGNEIRSRFDSERMGGGVPITGTGFSFMQAGSIRATFTFRVGDSTLGGLAYLYRIRNGASTTLWSGGYSTSNQTVTVDVSVLPGDRVYPYIHDFSQTVYLSNERYMTNGEDLYPGNSTPLEGNTYNA